MNELHFIQMQILRELLFKSNVSFTDLNIEKLDTDLFTYHINSLIKLGYIEKSNDKKYSLTTLGKKFSGNIDVENAKLKTQPKSTAIVITTKIENDIKYILLTERLKTPFKGFLGFTGGKIKQSEMIIDTAKRELQEETGLISGNIEFKYIIHEIVNSEENELLEDKIFFVFEETNAIGDPIDTLEGKSLWITEEEFYKKDKLFYDLIDLYDFLKYPPKSNFVERMYTVKKEAF